MHKKLLDVLDLSIISSLDTAELANQTRSVVEQLLAAEAVTFNRREREQFIEEVLDEVLGFGPLEPLLKDRDVSDILVNGPKQVYVERRGKLFQTDVQFKDDGHLLQVIDKIVSSVGRHIDEGQPMCDARLPDGSRVNAVIPPCTIDWPSLSIRKFSKEALTVNALLEYGSLNEEMAQVLDVCVRCRLNVLISGGTGSGKTTLLNILSSCIPEDERIVTIEDSAELQLQQPHVVRLETRPPNVEGKGEINQFDLLRNSLRMRPDRIIVGEIRGKEALDMLQAMNTGHDGSMSTIHANTPRDALSRMETMIAMAGLELPQRAMRHQISSALDLIVQIARLNDGTRKIMTIAEVLDMEGDVITMQDIFYFDRRGVDENGKVLGNHIPSGIQPRFMERVRAYGHSLPQGTFSAK
jgi:pilus assembly protein CpaF